MTALRFEVRRKRKVISQGTAWPVGEQLIATAFHVTSLRKGALTRPNQGYWAVDANGDVELQLAMCDPDDDIAFFAPKDKSVRWQPLPINTWGASPGANFSADGFPAPAGGIPLTAHGTVARLPDDYLPGKLQLGLGSASSRWQGSSGAPVIINRSVVGMLVSELMEASTLYAIAVDAIVRLKRVHETSALWKSLHEHLLTCTPPVLRRAEHVDAIGPLPQRADVETLAAAIVERTRLHGPDALREVIDAVDPHGLHDLKSKLVRLVLEQPPLRKHTTAPLPQPRTPYFAPPALTQVWSNFLEREPWDSRLREAIDPAIVVCGELDDEDDTEMDLRALRESIASWGQKRAELERILRRLERLSKNVYPTLREGDWSDRKRKAKSFEDLQEVKRTFHELTDAQYPFGRLFLILGSSGSGKSHFVSSVRHAAPLENERALVAPVAVTGEVERTQHGMEKAILAALEQQTGRHFADLTDFDDAIQRQDAERERCQHRYDSDDETTFEPTRVIIAIDGFDRSFSDGADAHAACTALQAVIDAATALPSIYWLLTCQDSRFHYLCSPSDGSSSFWSQYGCTSDFGQPPEPAESGVLGKDGWFDLDELNLGGQVGEKILAEKLGEEQLQSALEEGVDQPGFKRVRRELSQPWLAWALRDELSEEECLHGIRNGDLFFLGLARTLRHMRLAPLGGTPALTEPVRHYMKLLVGTFLRADGRRRRDSSFYGDMDRVASDLQGEWDRPSLQQQLDRLAGINLISDERDALGEAWLSPTRMVVWGLEGGEYLLRLLRSGTTQQIDATLLNSLGGGTDELGLKAGSVQLLCLLLDPEGPGTTKPATGLLNDLVVQPDLAPAVLYAAPKGSQELQALAVKAVARARRIVSSMFMNDARLTIAWLIMIDRAEELNFGERLHAVRPDFAAIREHGLSGYYFATAARIIDTVDDLENLHDCLLALAGCEQLDRHAPDAEGQHSHRRRDVASHLASRCVERLFALVEEIEDDGDEILEIATAEMDRYLEASAKDIAADYEAPRLPWTREFFREFVIEAFTQKVVEVKEDPAASFAFLWEADWYDHERENEPLYLEKSREANIAIGGFFWKKQRLLNPPREAGQLFVEMLETMVPNSHAERVEAVHLIRHTRPTFGGYDVEVSVCFHDLLEELATYPEIRDWNLFQRLYKSNVNRRPKRR